MYVDGYHGDCSNTFEVGAVDEQAKRLVSVTRKCLYSAINVCGPGLEICRIGKTIENLARKAGLSVVPAFCGHGIGKLFHEPPEILHYGNSFIFFFLVLICIQALRNDFYK